MEKYYFILHSQEKGTWLLHISFPTGDYISSFVSDLKQDGIRIYDYDIWSEETCEMAERELKHAKAYYDRTFQFCIEGREIEVTPREILQYYEEREDGFISKNEARCAKVVAGRKFADMDCTVMADSANLKGFLKCGDFKEGESMRFKLLLCHLWNVYIIRKKGKYQVKAYQSENLISHICYVHTKEEAILYCLNGFDEDYSIKEHINKLQK